MVANYSDWWRANSILIELQRLGCYFVPLTGVLVCQDTRELVAYALML